MNKLRGFVLTLLSSITGLSQAQEQSPLVINHLTGDFYIYTTFNLFNGKAFPSNSMYFARGSRVVLFDTPWDPSQTIPLLDSIRKRHGKEVSDCIVTHFHDDRTAGLDVLRAKGIRTWSTAQTYILSQERKEKLAEFTFQNDTIFTRDMVSFETYYPGPGHAPDNIVIWFPKDKILYGGCFVKSCENHSLGNIKDADVSEWNVSIGKVIKKYPHPEYVIPGHFNWDCRNSLQHTQKLIREALKK